MASAKGVAKGAIVRGISAEDLEKRKIVADNIREGSLTISRAIMSS